MSLFQAAPEKKDERRRTKSAIAGDTVWTKYKYQLSQLMNNIRKPKRDTFVASNQIASRNRLLSSIK